MRIACIPLLLTVLFFNTTIAQSDLHFDKRFVESEDHWVAFQQDKDGFFSYGFIYIDQEAGLSFKYEGRFTTDDKGIFIPKKLDSTNIIRLEANDVKVAFIPENRYRELEISAIPEWLKFYKTDTNSIQRLYRWGFLYNAWGESAKALTYLERAQKIEPKYQGWSLN